MSDRGIYVVGFGDPARRCALDLLESCRKYIPDIPVCFCGEKSLDGEDIFISQADLDVGGRIAKLKAYDLTPKEWKSVLYLDADTEIISSDVLFFFDLIEDGWEFAIAKDPHLMDTVASFRRKGNIREMQEIESELCTLHALMYNGGVWAFGRSKRIKAFFDRWQVEWQKHGNKDQGALLRAMYKDPLRVYLLGNEWNFFEKYSKGIEAVAIKHYPGKARRWKGQIPGRIDSKIAWNMVDRYLKTSRSGSRPKRTRIRRR